MPTGTCLNEAIDLVGHDLRVSRQVTEGLLSYEDLEVRTTREQVSLSALLGPDLDLVIQVQAPLERQVPQHREEGVGLAVSRGVSKTPGTTSVSTHRIRLAAASTA